jgi:hypothetical protein
MTSKLARRLRASVALTAVVAQLGATSGPAGAFCGFYVAKAEAKLFNKSSRVVLSRDGETTAITMASDYVGEPKEFAVVIPVPTFIERKQIRVVETKTINHLDAFTAPRLVEYYDSDPCPVRRQDDRVAALSSRTMFASNAAGSLKTELAATRYAGVTVEASYDVGEYDVVILSANESDGLVNWLNDNGYKIPAGAEAVLGSYIKQKMRFFVAKVNLDHMPLLANGYLRPLQVRYETAKFMIPLRLGTVNANGPQDLIVYALTRSGRVETANYGTVKLPSDVDVPLFVKQDFGAFYKAIFDRVVRYSMSAVVVEYVGTIGLTGKCDPCVADAMSNKELVELGARWIGTDDGAPNTPAQGANTYVTRIHLRYDATSFPEDLVLMETSDRTPFQGRYVLHHPWPGTAACAAGESYRAVLPARFEKEAANVAGLTGWPQAEIETRMEAGGQSLQGSR